MAEPPLTPPAARPRGARVPSGPRPAPLPLRSSPTASSRHTSAASIPKSATYTLHTQPSLSSLSKLAHTAESPLESLDALLGTEVDFTASPDDSPSATPAGPSRHISQQTLPPEAHVPLKDTPTSPPRGRTQGGDVQTHSSRETSQVRSKTLPDQRPTTPSSFFVSRPSTPSSMASPQKQKPKPKPTRLNTSNLTASNTMSSPTKISPGIKHWQQVRAHVMAPTPVEERPATRPGGKKLGLVSKAAGRFGFKNAADNVIGYSDRRRSMAGLMADLGGLSQEEREAISRERRRFARDIKTCLDACTFEESRRRLWRIGYGRDPSVHQETQSSAKSVHSSAVHAHPHAAQRFTFNPDYSSFAPLLHEIVKFLPDARAKRPWSRTIPHHSAILAELGVAFLQDATSTDGERQQALEVFGMVVRHWAADNADEVVMRWLWLCRAMLVDDRQLRSRGLEMLNSFLHYDPALPPVTYRPNTGQSFQRLAAELVVLLHAVETSQSPQQEHEEMVNGLLADLSEGAIIEVEESSLVDLLGSIEMTGSVGGVEKELMWMALASVVGTHPSLAGWLLTSESPMLQRFAPAPILHATPPTVLALRTRSTSLFLTSWSSLIRTSTDHHLCYQIWQSVHDLILPEIEALPDEDGALATHLGVFLLELELQAYRALPPASMAGKAEAGGTMDPFRISMGPQEVVQGLYEHREVLVKHTSMGAAWKSHFEAAAQQVIGSGPIGATCAMVQSFLKEKALLNFGKHCVNLLYTVFSTSSGPFTDARPFLLWLSKAHPQLFYKPLFTCSAATQPSTLTPPLKLVALLSELVGPAQFWTHADPQMVTIVLMGDVAPKQSKGKGKEGQRGMVTVKLGRYAVLVELLEIWKGVTEQAGSGSRLRAWIEGLEARLAVFLEAEEKDAALPDGYRALLCQLLFKMRLKTLSVKRVPWIALPIAWLIEVSRQQIVQGDDPAIKSLQTVYQSIAVQSDMAGKGFTSPPPSRANTASVVLLRQDSQPLPNGMTRTTLQMPLTGVVPGLLVVVHACLSADDWEKLLPHLWERYGTSAPAQKEVAFLLEKCAEVIPAQLRGVIHSDLGSASPVIRFQALGKVAALFGWRFQVLAQRIITDRRGPIFHFTTKTLDFVPTDVGSSQWVAPHDVQDAALQKFGQTLPLELRQRLMELGWSEDSAMQAKSVWEQMPVSSLPGSQYQQEGGLQPDRSPSPIRSLVRRGSSASGSSFSSKRRKAIFAPMLGDVATEQMVMLAGETNGLVMSVSRELTRLLQRDDSAVFLRPLTDKFTSDFPLALARLNSASTFLAPGFAYGAVNALIGFLKTVLRENPEYEYYETALATISRLIPHVSEMSLRDIRKNKAEHVLLPASIHEEEGGFKVHAPWRTGAIGVQTAQLLILTETLKANPREVYMVKKMLSNLQIQGCIDHLPFARAWLVLINTLFASVNRNYNDRAELRHFLTNVGSILRKHGQGDLLVTAYAMRTLMLCSARFRRVFTSMGFGTIMRSVYETYAGGNSAMRDCIEYAARSFYRIHQDTFVYQTCVVITEGDYDAEAVYSLLSSLSRGNSDASGVPSGVKGLNDSEEMGALVQMISGPEITLSEIGTEAAERQARKLASITLDDKLFPKENIVRLFVTVIASNPATKRAASFLALLADLIPQIRDTTSQDLLREGVEALGAVIMKSKTGDEASMLVFHPGVDNGEADWTRARRQYVLLVEAYARSGGRLGATATRRTLDMVLELLRKEPGSVSKAASSIVGELAKTHLSSTRPTHFLRDIAPLFRTFIAEVDFSGVLDSISDLVVRSNYELDAETTSIIVKDYVEPAVRMMASAAEDSMVYLVMFRKSAVRLLSVAVFLPGDALGALENHAPNASLLSSVVLPLCFDLQKPKAVDRSEVYSSLWIRILHYVLRAPQQRARGSKTHNAVHHPHLIAATAVLIVQIIKLIIVRAPSSISRVTGLWSHIAQNLLRTTQGGDTRFASTAVISSPPRVVDWMMWTLFELISLRPSPLHIEFSARIHQALADMSKEGDQLSRPASPGGPKMSTPAHQVFSGRARVASSGRTPSFAGHARSPSFAGHARSLSGYGPEVTPLRRQSTAVGGTLGLTPEHGGGHIRTPSASGNSPLTLSPASPTVGLGIMGHSRSPSGASISGPSPSASGPRASFADLSARRASRPAFEVLPSGSAVNYRFPSSAGVRNFGGTSEKAGGAIIHLLSAPNQVLSATSSGFPTLSPMSAGGLSPSGDGARGVGALAGGQRGDKALRDVTVKSEKLVRMARQAVRAVATVHGWQMEAEEEDEEYAVPRNWSERDAMDAILEQSRLFVEEEYLDVFSPVASNEWVDVSNRTSMEKGGLGLGSVSEEMSGRASSSYGRPSFDEKWGVGPGKEGVPLVSISSA
ncbi:hypothetical protein IAT38_000810 [Cryptococcus sp. DSM 104549]